MKTLQVSDATHRALVERKLDEGRRSMDEVIASLLGHGGRLARLRAAPGLDDLLRRHHVARLLVFGSAARGEDGPASDLDLIAEFEPAARPGLWGLAALGDDLAALVGTRVDITTPAGLHPGIRDRTLADAGVVWPA